VLRIRAAAGRVARCTRATLPDGAYVALRPRVEKWLGLREPELDYLLREHRRGRRFVDVGANWGSYTVLLQPNFDRIDAFEPIARCAAALRLYAAARDRAIGIHACALGDHHATVSLLVPLNDGFDRSASARVVPVASDANAIAVEARTLDSFGFDDVDFVKIDVEGYERNVISGASETLARFRPRLLVEIEQRHIDEPLTDRIAFIERLGYRASFLRQGRFVAASELVPARDQHPANVGKRERYINNFFFEPAR
jgi:FkbM family methyltransferase